MARWKWSGDRIGDQLLIGRRKATEVRGGMGKANEDLFVTHQPIDPRIHDPVRVVASVRERLNQCREIGLQVFLELPLFWSVKNGEDGAQISIHRHEVGKFPTSGSVAMRSPYGRWK